MEEEVFYHLSWDHELLPSAEKRSPQSEFLESVPVELVDKIIDFKLTALDIAFEHGVLSLGHCSGFLLKEEISLNHHTVDQSMILQTMSIEGFYTCLKLLLPSCYELYQTKHAHAVLPLGIIRSPSCCLLSEKWPQLLLSEDTIVIHDLDEDVCMDSPYALVSEIVWSRQNVLFRLEQNYILLLRNKTPILFDVDLTQRTLEVVPSSLD